MDMGVIAFIFFLLSLASMTGCFILFGLRKQALVEKKTAQEQLELTNKTNARQSLKTARDLDMARHIQSGLLIANKLQYKRYQLSAVCFPAEKIGGDFFMIQKDISNHSDFLPDFSKNVFKLSNKREETLNFGIGDVSGHGVASALVMILAKNTLEDLFSHRLSPQKIMQTANKKLIEYTEGSAINFVTAFCASLDVTNGKLTYSKAGHTPPILLKKSGEVILLETEGVFLGMFNNPEFEEKEVFLESGDKLFLYTDGLTEAKNKEDELMGASKLLELLQQNNWLSGENLFHKLMDDVKEYAGTMAINDDVTMVLLEVS